MEIVDDTQLVILARRPPTGMFPILERSKAFLPLLALLCVLPEISALPHRHQDETAALWGLRAIELSGKRWVQHVAAPSMQGAEAVLQWQPPLGTWITAGLIRLAGSANSLILLAVSLLGTAMTVFVFAMLMRTLASDRVAIWSVLFGCCLAPVLRIGTTEAPVSFGILFALISLWGFFSHLEQPRRISWRLLTGGVGLGLCLLSGGPLALVMVGLLFLQTLGLRGESLSRKQFAEPRTINVWAGWPAMRSLAVMSLIGFLVGGWWPMFRWSQDGDDFLAGWMFGVLPSGAVEFPGLIAEAAELSTRDSWRDFLIFGGPMLGMVTLGLLRNLHAAAVSREESRRRCQLFLLLWTILCGVMYGDAVGGDNRWPHLALQWEAMLSLAMAGVAGYCVEEITQRHVAMRLVAGVVIAVAAAISIAGAGLNDPELFRLGLNQALLLTVIVLGVVLWKFFYSGVDRDLRHRIVLAILVISPVVGVALGGLQQARRATEDDVALQIFSSGIHGVGAITDVMIIGESEEMPIRLQLAVRASSPLLPMEFVDSWEAVLARSVSAVGAGGRQILAIDWSGRINRPVNLQAAGIQIQTVVSPRFFSGGPLRGYLVRTEVPSPGKRTAAQGISETPSPVTWGE